ncbi:phage tail protein [Agarilytica rhodophyticola]|uniref:phage tail protein n=1 Tax=Agarilytica rhodophyticola TaxID=1737490 RepID=UPI000B344B9E|nr:phage tail protein [Agarilytica rhodophyticola]
MALLGIRNDPFLSFRFVVLLDGITLAGFSECSGLQLETEFEEYMEGGENLFVHKFPTRTKQSNLVLKRGIVDRELWDWYAALIQGQVRPKDGIIVVYDPSGSYPQIVWQFSDALPQKWQGPDLNASQSNVAVETLELSYFRLERRL